jgi:hypothetical protein
MLLVKVLALAQQGLYFGGQLMVHGWQNTPDKKIATYLGPEKRPASVPEVSA